MNMLRTKRACHALGVRNRTGSRKAGSAPPKRSCTNTSGSPLRWARADSSSRAKWASESFSFRSHHTSADDPGSSTTNLSLGLRPVWGEVMAAKAPLSLSWPSSRRTACSTSRLGDRFAQTRSGARPWTASVALSG